MTEIAIKDRRDGMVLITGASVRLAVAAAAARAGALHHADLSGMGLRYEDMMVPLVPALDAQILAALNAGGTLQMGQWHTCRTSHCQAGWAIHLAGHAGFTLAAQLGPFVAAALIYQVSTGRIPNFYATTAEALADLRGHAAGS